MQYSHSRVECFGNCPYMYSLKYIQGLKTPPNTEDPANALLLGSALHLGIEKGVKEGVRAYFDAYPIITDAHINEAMKLENLIPRVQKLLPENVIFEKRLSNSHFIGFIDLLVNRGDGEFELYDFKYSNHVDKYLTSAQLHLYKHYFEEENPNCKIVKMGFIFIPKTAIRQKKTEDLSQFRKRLTETLNELEIKVETVEYNPNKVIGFLTQIKTIQEAKLFPKNETRLCDWCDYKLYCKEGLDYMILPKNERRQVNVASRKKIWLYGAPFSGKTTLADSMPNPIMLNTDGNLNSFTAPVVEIKETLEGRIRVPAWEVLKNAIDELQKGSEFETVVLDLVEDAFEHCRLYCYDKLGIEHESDNSFKAWDYVRTEFLSTMKKLMTLPYNVVLISHEDTSKDITKKTGDKITAIKPNIQEKTALKLAGMVDIVARVVADGDDRTLQFKSDDVVFGGGRLKLLHTVVPLSYEALEKVYEEAGGKPKIVDIVPDEENPLIVKPTKDEKVQKIEESKEHEHAKESVVHNEPTGGESESVEHLKEDVQEEAPTRRRRGRPAKTEEVEAEAPWEGEEAPKEDATPVRRRRRRVAAE